MKKYSKILTLLIALVMVVSIFSGFTYAPSQVVAMGDHNGHVHTVAVDNLALVNCPSCGGSGKATCPACGGTEKLPDGTTCGDCYTGGTINCTNCNGTGKVQETVPDPVPTVTPPTPTVTPPTPTVTPPAPTVSPDPKCEVHAITFINDVAYTLDIDNFVGETAKIELKASSSKGHNLTYSWTKDGVAINNTTAIYTEVCNSVGSHTLDCSVKCSTCNVTNGGITKITTTVKPVVTPSPSPVVTPSPSPIVPVKTSKVEFHLIDNINYSNDSKLFFNMNAPTDIKLGDFKTKYLNTNNLVKGFYTWDVLGYHKVNDYDKITSSGTKKIYMLVDNVNLILDVQAPTLENPVTIVKKQSIKVDFVVDGKIFTTINVLESEVPNTSYFIEPPFNLTKTFKGWGLKADAIDVISATWKPTTNSTLYAIYSATVVEKTSNTLIIIVVVVAVLALLFVIYSIFGKKNYRR